MERAVKWYYKRIHACDLNGWERSVERNEQMTSFTHISHDYHHHMMRKRDHQEYVDIDVVRGSAWSKSKARQGAVMVLMDGLARIIMFPFFITWWVDQLTLTSALFFSLLHVAMATSLACYILNPGEFTEVPAGEVAVPYALMIIVGSIHCQIVSTTTTTSHDVMGWMGQEVRMEGDKQDTSVDDDDIIPSLSSEDTINVRVWEGGRCVKMPLNFVQIGAAIMRKAYFSNARGHLEGAKTSVLGATCAVPFLHRLHRHRGTLNKMDAAYRLMYGGGKWFVRATVGVSFVSRAILTMSLAVMLVTTDRTFRKRLRHAKHFSHLTSVRRAAKSGLPHFRLSKMARVKAWLSLRSYLQRRGPQRSTDIVLSAAYTAFMLLLCFSTVKIMGSSSSSFNDSLLMWECLAWQVSLGLFLLGYVFTGAQIHRKYAANCSILLTEQFNVFMQMENFPEKKEKLQRVNNALTVTSKLIKESRASSSIFGGGGGGGLTKNPLFYNLLKVLVLSAVSGAVSEVLGFKVKVWKIKD